ncbi:MAG: SoxR reducing system RseC family protein [Spirochaetaceae bacterium]|nr:SoxR reducing system RseC family protein [Spirochaetaceae bacterium]
MIKTGRVREMSGDLVIIDLDRTGACGGCGYGEPRNRACGIAVEEKKYGGGEFSGPNTKPTGLPRGTPASYEVCRPNPGRLIALNREKLPLSPGQRVAVKFPPGSVLAQTLAALLPPLLGLIAGYVLGGLWGSPAGNQVPRAAAGGVGFVIFAGIVYFIRKYLPPGRPTVVYYMEDTISCLKDRSQEGPFNLAGP